MSVLVTIRKMEQRDVLSVAALYRACFGSAAWSAEDLEHTLANPDYLFFVAEAVSGIVGFYGILCAIDSADLVDIGVSPAYRGQAAGTALMEHLFMQTAERGIDTVMLEVRESNLPAIALYRKFHFQEIARRTGYYRNPVEDAIVMSANQK